MSTKYQKKLEFALIPSASNDFPVFQIYQYNDKFRLTYHYDKDYPLDEKYKPVNFHLYVITEETPKEGDWCVNFKSGVVDNVKVGTSRYNLYGFGWRKIIATSNTSIDLPRFSRTFMLDYCTDFNKGKRIKWGLISFKEINGKEIPVVRTPEKLLQIQKPKSTWSTEEVRGLLLKYIKENTQVVSEDDMKWIKEHI